MNNLSIRASFYALCGIVSALLGWSISQILWQEIGTFLMLFVPKEFSIPPYIILLIIVTPCITSGMIIAETFISNPTRYKTNWRFLTRTFFKKVFIVGSSIGLFLGIFNWILLQSNWPGGLVRIISWIIIGAFAGLAESISWSWRSIEGTRDRVKQRILQSTGFGAGSGLLAASFCEAVNTALGQYQEPFGFFLFGGLLGLSLCFAAKPSYQVALRAGTGFEATKKRTRKSSATTQLQVDSNAPTQLLRPTLNNQSLKYIPDNDYKHIEEGVSIQLPAKTKKLIIIGSGDTADIYIPHLPEECASLQVNSDNVIIRCLAEESVKIQQRFLPKNQTTTLKHNQILTLYHENNEEKFYRFIFYNRLLDPQA
jgi:hypothetical protein